MFFVVDSMAILFWSSLQTQMELQISLSVLVALIKPQQWIMNYNFIAVNGMSFTLVIDLTSKFHRRTQQHWNEECLI